MGAGSAPWFPCMLDLVPSLASPGPALYMTSTLDWLEWVPCETHVLMWPKRAPCMGIALDQPEQVPQVLVLAYERGSQARDGEKAVGLIWLVQPAPHFSSRQWTGPGPLIWPMRPDAFDTPELESSPQKREEKNISSLWSISFLFNTSMQVGGKIPVFQLLWPSSYHMLAIIIFSLSYEQYWH